MSFYRHIGGKCISHKFETYVDLIKQKYWEQCIHCGKRK
jgi:hypothetical protein